jgi:hypothetical protein
MFNDPKGASMENTTHHGAELPRAGRVGAPVPLDRETRAAVDTETAAYHLNRAPQTLRIWACKENGPLRPLRIHGRLAWSTAEIRRLLGVTE